MYVEKNIMIYDSDVNHCLYFFWLMTMSFCWKFSTCKLRMICNFTKVN